jgi:TonB family protein
MAHHPISRPDPFNPPGPSAAPISLDPAEGGELADGLSLAELATALSAHGGGALSADLALDLVLNEIVEHARLATGATAAAIALARGDEIVCRATTGENAPDLGVKLDVDAGLSGACVQSKQWQRCDDTETDSRVDAEVCRDLGVRSILVFPVVREEKLLGVFEIFSPRPNAFSDREIQTLQALSRSIINNVNRAADVLAPPMPMFPSSSAEAATAAIAADVESVDHLPVDSVPVDPAPVDPAPDFEPFKHAPPDTPLRIIEPVPAITISEVYPRDYSMVVLTLAVIALALSLGWMLGYVRSPRGSVGARAKAAVSVPSSPASAATPQGTRLNASPAATVPDQTAPGSAPAALVSARPSGTPPSESQPSGTVAPPPGGLVVYEDGKVIFRTPPQSPHHAAKDTTSQPVQVPSKVADEYLVLRVEPEYPEAAREQHIQGPVVLEALVGKDGTVEKLSTISGDSQLATAATDAVQQWRFKPFFKNGAPEEFQTQITVSFRLP